MEYLYPLPNLLKLLLDNLLLQKIVCILIINKNFIYKFVTLAKVQIFLYPLFDLSPILN
jgi:hypothetical protein